jgi:hypothetical protein
LAVNCSGGVVAHPDPALVLLVVHERDRSLLITVRPDRPDVRIVQSDPRAADDAVLTVADAAARAALLDLARRLAAHVGPLGTAPAAA